jgi:hypothetical protein
MSRADENNLDTQTQTFLGQLRKNVIVAMLLFARFITWHVPSPNPTFYLRRDRAMFSLRRLAPQAVARSTRAFAHPAPVSLTPSSTIASARAI